MNANAKALVAALRSGEYEQGRNALHIGNKFCCLGVACDLHSKTTAKGWENGVFYLHEYLTLPDVVRDWLGFANVNGSFSGGTASLATLNDEGKSFDEIADVIESEPKGLFA